jgi:hypothetical protein
MIPPLARLLSHLAHTLRWVARPGQPDDPRRKPALLPTLGPFPGRLLPLAVVLLLTAWLLLLPASLEPWSLIPGDPEHTDVGATISYHWLVDTAGLAGSTHSRLLGFPLGIDRTIMNGFPLDVLLSSSLASVLGWPAGYTVFYVLELWLFGVSMAWLAGRWWRSPLAALVAGVVVQSGGVITLELQQGRTAQIFGAIFLPPALAYFSTALSHNSRRAAAWAGIAVGMAMLTYWYYAWFFGLALGVLLALALLERRPLLRPTLIAGACTLAVIALPLAYTLGGLDEQTGMAVSLDTKVTRGSTELTVYELVQGLSVDWGDVLLGELTLGPMLLVLAALGTFRSPIRRTAAPLLWVAVGWLCSQGVHAELPLGNGELLAPFAISLRLPLLRRLWWPHRAFLILLPAVALLAAGGAVWLRRRVQPGSRWLWLLPALLLGEAYLVLPQLPLDATVGGANDHTRALAQRDGPLLVLPSSGGYLRESADPLVHQTQHGRPLVNWTMHPHQTNVPEAYRALAERGQLGFLYQCEAAPDTDPSEARWNRPPTLSELGVTDVYLDLEAMADAGKPGEQFQACIEQSLGAPVERIGPFARYLTTSSSHPLEAPAP